MSALRSWLERRFEPIDNAALVVFRLLFGALLFFETAGALATGWVTRAYVAPTVHFPMVGFEWLPHPGSGMYAYYAAMAGLALLVMVGVAFRVALVAFLVLWTGAYVLQTANYNNHYYLLALLCALLATTPADADCSLKARASPERRKTRCPRWCCDIFVWQTAILFAFAAYAKVSADWLAAKPLTIWLREISRTRAFGEVYATPYLPWFLAWGGLAFDALVVPALLWPRTRRLAFAAACLFHLFNSVTFRVGVFPYLGIVLCLFFFPPETVRRRFLGAANAVAAAAKPSDHAVPTTLDSRRRAGIALFAAYFALQLFLPLRHHLYPGSVDWHEEGYRMSWRMMLRAKSGRVVFRVRDPDTGETWRVDPRRELTSHQGVRIGERPDMIWLYARYLRDDFARRGHPRVEVFADSRVSLNGRPRAPLIDPAVDLAATPWRFLRYNGFITPEPMAPAPK